MAAKDRAQGAGREVDPNSNDWEDVRRLSPDQHAAVLDYRVRILEQFVERMGPVWDEMRGSLRTIVDQNAASLKAQADYEARLRLLEKSTTGTDTAAGFLKPVAIAVIASLLSSAATYLAVSPRGAPHTEEHRR